MISILSGANNALLPEDIRESERVFENTAFCLVQTEIPMETVSEVCRIAKEHGAQTILKPVACGELPVDLLRQCGHYHSQPGGNQRHLPCRR